MPDFSAYSVCSPAMILRLSSRRVRASSRAVSQPGAMKFPSRASRGTSGAMARFRSAQSAPRAGVGAKRAKGRRVRQGERGSCAVYQGRSSAHALGDHGSSDLALIKGFAQGLQIARTPTAQTQAATGAL